MKGFKTALVWMLVLTLAFGQVVLAVPGNDKKDKGDDDIKGYQMMNDKKVILGNTAINLDMPPVIKEGRTLIPVRAVVQALKAKVEWDGATGIVTVTNQQGNIIIKFYLKPEDQGKVTVTDSSGTRIVPTDSKPGKINNSTYVPLRFIAETFGLKVDNGKNGINLSQGPMVVPKQVKYYAESEIPEWVTVSLVLNGFTFTGIKDMAPANYTYDSATTVKIAKAYVLSLTAEETKLYFQFTKDSKLELKEFEIELEYKSTTSAAIKMDLTPDELKNPVGDKNITMTLNGYTFTGILKNGAPLQANVDYVVVGNVVTLKSAFLDTLKNAKKTNLFFFFTNGTDVLNHKLEIEFEK